jgi:hypothetical protein
MTREYALSRGEASNRASVVEVMYLSWASVVEFFMADPAVTDDKASPGWYAMAEFRGNYREEERLEGRHALTFDFDAMGTRSIADVLEAYKRMEFVAYTTHSHQGAQPPSEEHPDGVPEKPRLRMVIPLDRAVSAEEFRAISRKVGAAFDINILALESHTPAQYMYMPSHKEGAEYLRWHNEGRIVNADFVLSKYEDWTDRSSWPAAVGDHVGTGEKAQDPRTKDGIIGEFCRAYTITDAIEKFSLPYKPRSDGRWDYTLGSRDDGARTYDDDTKIHNENGTNPAHGQQNAFDLVRLHRFGKLDDGAEAGTSVTELPSFRAMCELAGDAPELRAAQAAEDFEDLGPLTEEQTLGETPKAGAIALARRVSDVLRNPTLPRWLIRDELERGVIAVMAGPRGSYKSFIALDWAMRCATSTNMGHPVDQAHPVYVVSAEGGDFDRRARAWLTHFTPDLRFEDVPLYVVERRMDLNTKEGIDSIRADCLALSIRPVLFVLDTFSKLSGGLDENDNTSVKQFIGRLDNGLKRAETAFDATVLLVAHTGHSDTGRPRGASALMADTDAEYIVAKDGETVLVSRERFKASAELPPLSYRSQKVGLGYSDDEGIEIDSLVMISTDPPRAPKNAKDRPSGACQQIMYDLAKKMTAGGDPVSTTLLISATCDALPVDEIGKRDNRRQSCRTGLNALVAKKLLYMDKQNRISLHDIETATDEDWLT